MAINPSKPIQAKLKRREEINREEMYDGCESEC